VELTVVGGTLFFNATDGASGFELWKSDGTEVGTVQVKDITPGPAGSYQELADVGGALFLSASDGASGFELWGSDGTEAGTVRVRDIYPGATSSTPAGLTDVGGTLFFSAADATNSIELWKMGLVSTCSLSGSTLTVAINSFDDVTIRRSGSSLSVSNIDITDPTCGGATVANVDTVNVTGTSLPERVVLDLSGGAFAPGATPEATGVSDIEIDVDLGSGTDRLVVQGASGIDRVQLGSDGINLNNDDDVDATVAGVEEVTVNGGLGNDLLTAAGSPATGDAFFVPVLLNGDGGNDTLTGGEAPDVLTGGAGNDMFKETKVIGAADSFLGGSGTDTLTYAARAGTVKVTLDGVANDGANQGAEGDNVSSDVERLIGGKGKDTLTGTTSAANVLTGGAGNDTIDVRDGVSGNDTANGGAGTDTCLVDAGDTRVGCEP
jgi:ELWxxDGT repeat protein